MVSASLWRRSSRGDKKKNMGTREDYVRASLALSMIPSIGGGRIRRLFEHFRDPMSVFSADWASLSAVASIGAIVARSIRDFSEWEKVDRLLMMTKKHGMALLTPYDECYPGRLLHIYDPPAVLWARGNTEALKRDFLAVVGTRKPTCDGRDVTIRLTRSLIQKTQAGIVSGLAHGVDTLAHLEALRNKRCTVAVMACGLDRVYPAGNRSLAFDIMKSGGAMISEYPPGTKPESHHFPVRNRIVSGMSVGVVVTETGVSGGSMITASAALDQGREVFAVPHSVWNERGEGCNRIIQRGWGKLVSDAEDIISELPLNMRLDLPSSGSGEIPQAFLQRVRERLENPGTDPSEKAVLQLLADKERHIDEISREAGIASHVLLTLLLKLELDGIILQVPGKKFTLSKL